jgi:hypothetical protein
LCLALAALWWLLVLPAGQFPLRTPEQQPEA